MEVNKQRRKLLKLGGLLPLGWLLSGCGGGGSSKQSTSSPPVITRPEIVSHPVSQTAVVGEIVTYSVVATGSVLSYQWQRDGTDIPGASDASFVPPPVTLADNGAVFTVIVSNSAGSVNSDQATLAVSQRTVSVDSLVVTVDSVLLTVDEI